MQNHSDFNLAQAVSQLTPSPCGVFSRAEDKLKRRVETEDTFTRTPDSRIWDFSPMGSGTAKTRFDRTGATGRRAGNGKL